MMKVGNYTVHRRASTALNQLDADERAQVLERLASLLDVPVAQWPAGLAKRLAGDEPIYVVRVGDSLRAFVQAAEGQPPEVLDVARQETHRSAGAPRRRTRSAPGHQRHQLRPAALRQPPGAPKPVTKQGTGQQPGGQPGHPPRLKRRLPPERLHKVMPFVPSHCDRCHEPLPPHPGRTANSSHRHS